MKYVKMLGLAAVAAAALMAFVGASTASATVLCKTTGTGSPTGTTCPAGSAYAVGQPIHAVNVGNTLLKDDGSGATLITCTGSTLQGEITNAGGTGTVSGPISSLTFTGCDQHVTVLKPGTLEVHWIENTHNGTLTSNGAEVTTLTTTIFGNIHCIYVTNNTHLGELTDGNPAIVHANAIIPQKETSALCPGKARWVATYEVTTPKPLSVAGHN